MTIKDVFEVARNLRPVELEKICPDMEKVRRANEDYMELRRREIIYGDRTGYGVNVEHVIGPDEHREKQKNLVLGLNCGSGDPLREDQVRAAIFVRLLVLSQGYSCVRPEILDCLCEMLNKNDVPHVPSLGSIGASGDLVPSSYYAIEVLKKMGGLEGREGLALVNGTQFMTGIAALVVEDFTYLFQRLAELFTILFQCHRGIEDVIDAELHFLKKHEEQVEVAAFLRKILEGSKLLRNVKEITSQKTDASGNVKPIQAIQDRYSMIRCLAQELGPIVRCIRDVHKVVENELNGVSDNPVFVNGKIGHGGNFDGAYVAQGMEDIKQSMRTMAYIARAHMRSTIDSKLNHDVLPMYLVSGDKGLNNGLQGLMGLGFDGVFMNLEKNSMPDRVFAKNDHEGVNQDIVSNGMNCALSASRMISDLANLTARMMIMTRQAVYLLKIEDRLSPATQDVFAKLAKLIAPIKEDRSLDHELHELEKKLFYHVI